MQEDFISGALGSKEAQAIVPVVIEKIAAFDGDVVYTRDTHTANYLETAEGKKLPVLHSVKDTPGWQIHPDLHRAGEGKTAAVIDKPTFGSAELGRLAVAGNYDAIELVGLCTVYLCHFQCSLPEGTSVGDNDCCLERLLRRCNTGASCKCTAGNDHVSD